MENYEASFRRSTVLAGFLCLRLRRFPLPTHLRSSNFRSLYHGAKVSENRSSKRAFINSCRRNGAMLQHGSSAMNVCGFSRTFSSKRRRNSRLKSSRLSRSRRFCERCVAEIALERRGSITTLELAAKIIVRTPTACYRQGCPSLREMPSTLAKRDPLSSPTKPSEKLVNRR